MNDGFLKDRYQQHYESEMFPGSATDQGAFSLHQDSATTNPNRIRIEPESLTTETIVQRWLGEPYKMNGLVAQALHYFQDNFTKD